MPLGAINRLIVAAFHPQFQILNMQKDALTGLPHWIRQMKQDQKEDFCKKSYIPENVSLEFDNFNEFYEKRKELLEKKIRSLLG